MRLIILGAGLAAALSLAGLLAMTGALRSLASPDLSAEVHLAEFPLPQGFGLEPQEVAEFLTVELTTRANDDIALRLGLGTDGQKKLVEIAIPRLVNSVVVRDMIANIKPLANVLSVGDFRLAGRVLVVNRGDARSDVALTLPGLLLAEAASGGASIETTSTGLTALTLGDMQAGEQREVKIWLGQPALDAGAGFKRQVLLGDASGAAGRVWIYDAQGWAGADLQAIALARWAIAGVLAIVLGASLLVLAMAVLARFGRAGRAARRVTLA